jgi:hypothetical protein
MFEIVQAKLQLGKTKEKAMNENSIKRIPSLSDSLPFFRKPKCSL